MSAGPTTAAPRWSLRLERVATDPPGLPGLMVEARAGAWAGSAPLVLLMQLAAQYLFFLALRLFDPRQSVVNVAGAYGTVFALQGVERALRPGRPFRVLSTLAMCNTVCLFYAASVGRWPYLALLASLAWLSRTFVVNARGRHVFNPGTFGVFWGGLLCSAGFGLGASIHPISHAFTHIPHFTIAVAALGALMAYAGGHLDVVLALLAGTYATRGYPSSAELIIFLFAATDPVTIPRQLWHRLQFGLMASIATGVLWRLTSNELVKVAGLVATGLVMPFFVRVDYGAWMSWHLGRFGTEAFWSRRPLRVAAALALVGYGFLADASYPYRQQELFVRVTDARTGAELGRADARALFAGDIEARYGATRLRIGWADLYGCWNWNSQGIHPGPLRPDTPMRLTYRLACRPDAEENSPRFVEAPRIVEGAPAGNTGGANARTIVLRVNVAAIRAACVAR